MHFLHHNFRSLRLEFIILSHDCDLYFYSWNLLQIFCSNTMFFFLILAPALPSDKVCVFIP